MGEGVWVAVALAIGVVLFLAISANRRSRRSDVGADRRTDIARTADQSSAVAAGWLATGAFVAASDGDKEPDPDAGGDAGSGDSGGGSWGDAGSGDGGGGGGGSD